MENKAKTRSELLLEVQKLKIENEALKKSFTRKSVERDRANEKFRMLFERSPIGMALVDHESGEFLEVNKAVLKASGYTKKEFMNLSYWDITPRKYEAQELQQIESLNTTGSFGPNTKEYIRKDGSRYPISISGALYTEITGEKVVWGIIEDITHRKLAESTINRQNEELKDLNAAKNRFITILAHDLKSPFTSILGLVELLLHNFESASREKILEYLQMINSVTKNTHSLLDDILLWIKADTNKIDFEPTSVNVGSFYTDVFEMFKPIAQSKHIEIAISVTDDIDIFADKNMLKTVLRNLISNAIKFTHPNGKIEVRTELIDKNLLTTISDNGVGIEPDRASKLFSIRTTGSTFGTSNESGTGLGLLICKEFVDKHGGEIWVKSEPGKGTKFKFSLPH